MGGGHDTIFSSFVPVIVLFSLTHIPLSAAQPAPRLPPLSPGDSCVGIFLAYSGGLPTRIHPILLTDPKNQPYSVADTATISNFDSVPLQAWKLVVGYPPRTILVSVSSAVLDDGSTLPYTVGQNGTVGATFSGYPNPDLKTAIETAGDASQTEVQMKIVGTQFGVDPSRHALPSTIALTNPGYICPRPTVNTTTVYVCCVRDHNFKANDSALSDKFHDPQEGDLIISYDVIQSLGASYVARVNIQNRSPMGRLDNWQLSWEWQRGEFINKMQGAITNITDVSGCINGRQGQYYQNFDFSKVLNCDPRPTIVDLPPQLADDSVLGGIPFCCRNGTILPTAMDPTRSSSAFQIEVYKMPPDLNRSTLYPPVNWAIQGSASALNPVYNCSQPIRVKPTPSRDPTGLPTSTTAIATWQVTCNIYRPVSTKPRCCVSYSAFYNDSVIPCRTCACGCPSVPRTCSATTPALLLPPDAMLIPFDNRTIKARAWANIKHIPVPDLLPCGDYCGVSVNWHIYTDYTGGWSVRITLFNWEDIDIADWFAAVVMPKAYDGFETMYSFNGTIIGTSTIFMQGLPGLNYLVKEDLEVNPGNPGKLQTLASFSKKKTPDINVPAGDGFPQKLIFNGEECALPYALPASKGFRIVAASYSLLLPLTSTLLMMVRLYWID